MKNSCSKKYEIIFITNLVNHHLIPVADELYKHVGDGFLYIATEALPDWLKNGGYEEIMRPYILNAYKYNDNIAIQEFIDNAEVVIIGAANDRIIFNRLKNNKITFHYNERWFKDGYYHLLSPRAWRYWLKYHTRFRNKRSYMLCASAYTAPDVHKVFAYPNKCFKWGYFTSVPEFDINGTIIKRRENSKLRLLWVARFLGLKHPELAIKLAGKLKDNNVCFELNMYGSGELMEYSERLIRILNLEKHVFLRGNLPNSRLVKEMRQHHIFIFTSDRNEGWGAVVNEAMSNGCAVISSDQAGASKFLIEHGKNGLLFKSGDLTDFYQKTVSLVNNIELREKLSIQAYYDMLNIWSPQNAALRLIHLIDIIKNNGLGYYSIKTGPCSIAK